MIVLIFSYSYTFKTPLIKYESSYIYQNEKKFVFDRNMKRFFWELSCTVDKIVNKIFLFDINVKG